MHMSGIICDRQRIAQDPLRPGLHWWSCPSCLLTSSISSALAHPQGPFKALTRTHAAHAAGQPSVVWAGAKGAAPAAGNAVRAAELGPNGISWHGGKVMMGTVNVYVVWYGNWTADAKLILTDLLQSIGVSTAQRT